MSLRHTDTRTGTLSMAFVLMLGLMMTTARAEDEDPLFDVKLFEGGLDASYSWNSNPYYRDGMTEESGTVLNLAPSISLSYPFSDYNYLKLLAVLDYTYVYAPDAEDIELTQPYFEALYRQNFGPHTSLSLSDLFQSGNVDVDDDGVAGRDDNEYDLNTARLQLAHQINERVQANGWVAHAMADAGDSQFDYTSAEGGLGVEYTLDRSASGRDFVVTLGGSAGEKDFEDEVVFGGPNRTNPKSHSYESFTVGLKYPLGPGMTARLSGGLTQRDYDVVYAATLDGSVVPDKSTDAPHVAASFTVVPGGIFSVTLAGSYELTDTLIYNREGAQRDVFDSIDPLVNNLQIAYRQQEVYRFGLTSDYAATDTLSLGLGAVYQQAKADREEDLRAATGQVNVPNAELDEKRYTIAARARWQVSENVETSLVYEHGEGEDASRSDDELYSFDTVGLTVRLGWPFGG